MTGLTELRADRSRRESVLRKSRMGLTELDVQRVLDQEEYVQERIELFQVFLRLSMRLRAMSQESQTVTEQIFTAPVVYADTAGKHYTAVGALLFRVQGHESGVRLVLPGEAPASGLDECYYIANDGAVLRGLEQNGINHPDRVAKVVYYADPDVSNGTFQWVVDGLERVVAQVEAFQSV